MKKTDGKADLLGEAVLDFCRTGHDLPVRLWINGQEDHPLYPSIFFRQLKDMPELEKEALKHARGRILDAGAGAGCHSLSLIENGHRTSDVISLDLSSEMCEVMRSRGLSQVWNKNLMDVRDESFDTILLLMNGFGIAGTEDGLRSLVGHLSGLLKPGGRILGESTDVFYMFADEEGVAEIDLRARYYGEVEFKMRFRNRSSSFHWIYPDEHMLEEIARHCGLRFEILFRGETHNFLCSMEKC